MSGCCASATTKVCLSPASTLVSWAAADGRACSSARATRGHRRGHLTPPAARRARPLVSLSMAHKLPSWRTLCSQRATASSAPAAPSRRPAADAAVAAAAAPAPWMRAQQARVVAPSPSAALPPRTRPSALMAASGGERAAWPAPPGPLLHASGSVARHHGAAHPGRSAMSRACAALFALSLAVDIVFTSSTIMCSSRQMRWARRGTRVHTPRAQEQLSEEYSKPDSAHTTTPVRGRWVHTPEPTAWAATGAARSVIVPDLPLESWTGRQCSCGSWSACRFRSWTWCCGCSGRRWG